MCEEGEMHRRDHTPEQANYRWRNQYGVIKANLAKRLKELEEENA
jgi:hypothetical protein